MTTPANVPSVRAGCIYRKMCRTNHVWIAEVYVAEKRINVGRFATREIAQAKQAAYVAKMTKIFQQQAKGLVP